MSTLLDRALSDRVLYPALGLVLVGALLAVVVRPRRYGPAEPFDAPVVGEQGEMTAEVFRLTAHRGHPVLIDFWASWCGPCRAQMPALVRLHQRFRARGLVVVGVNVDQNGAWAVPSFRRRLGIEYPMVYDVGGEVSERYHVEGLPTLVLVDRDGTVRLRHAGVASEESLADAVEGLL
jgi:thiol-disulfide isomerase/thioredoxin